MLPVSSNILPFFRFFRRSSPTAAVEKEKEEESSSGASTRLDSTSVWKLWESVRISWEKLAKVVGVSSMMWGSLVGIVWEEEEDRAEDR